MMSRYRHAIGLYSKQYGRQLVTGAQRVINPALKGRALWRPDVEHAKRPLSPFDGCSRAALPPGQSRATRTAFQNFGSIEVSMVRVATAAATKSLRRTELASTCPHAEHVCEL
jgi:hypothetical protein